MVVAANADYGYVITRLYSYDASVMTITVYIGSTIIYEEKGMIDAASGTYVIDSNPNIVLPKNTAFKVKYAISSGAIDWCEFSGYKYN